jgi:hypothetical protein
LQLARLDSWLSAIAIVVVLPHDQFATGCGFQALTCALEVPVTHKILRLREKRDFDSDFSSRFSGY